MSNVQSFALQLRVGFLLRLPKVHVLVVGNQLRGKIASTSRLVAKRAGLSPNPRARAARPNRVISVGRVRWRSRVFKSRRGLFMAVEPIGPRLSTARGPTVA